MNEKVLRLRLYFKGKQINYAASIGNKESLIENKMYLGSADDIFWQIVDPKFPKKHLFVVKQNNLFNVMLTNNMRVDVKKGDNQELTIDDLKKNKLLNGNTLTLAPDTNGTIHLNSDYEISYSFGDPYVAKYTPQQETIIKQYHRWEELTSEARFTRNFVIIAMIISFIGMAIFSRTYKPPVVDNSLESRLAAIRETQAASKVGTSFADLEQGTASSSATQEEVVPEEQGKKDDFAGMTAGERSAAAAAMAQSLLGFDVSDTQELVEIQGPAYAVTSETIVAAAAGGGGGRGPGKGKGNGPGKPGAGAGPGIGGAAGGLDNSASVLSQVGAASLMTESELRGAGTAITDLSQLAGGGTAITAGNVQVISGQSAVSMIASFRARNIKVVSEEGPKEELTAAEKGNFEMIKRFVDMRKKQIVQLFERERQVQNIYGILNVTIEVDVNGVIKEAGVEGSAGSVFTPDFLNKTRTIILGWKFPMKLQEAVGYGFSLILRS
ncbi:MAG: hypothetical protein JXR56_01175 [Candidatus Cloacimonetes bacterium]|nr:hypothetical protein [Candidatus Cloacimonadota bacterium]